MNTSIEWKSRFRLLLVIILIINMGLSSSNSICAALQYSIELEDFRWDQFPLKVFVDMNQWSLPEYSTSIREALDNWVGSIWNYTHSFANMTLTFSYIFYLSHVNFTRNYDLFVTFTPNEMPSQSGIVGLTKFKWDTATHRPISPITINLTTYSATADSLFIKNVAMHEFGHAFGLGHASSPNTLNGPELMYYSSTKAQVVYPSTLDVYGLLALYDGSYGQTVQLPNTIPYQMISDSHFPSQIQTSPLSILYPSTSVFQYLINTPGEIFYQPMILLIPCIVWMMIALVFGMVFRSGMGGVVVTVTLSFIIAYFATTWYMDLVLLSLKLVLLLPGILFGALSGGFLGCRFLKVSKEAEKSDSYY